MISAYAPPNPALPVSRDGSQGRRAFFKLPVPNRSFGSQCTLSVSNCRYRKPSMLHYLGIRSGLRMRQAYLQSTLYGLERYCPVQTA